MEMDLWDVDTEQDEGQMWEEARAIASLPKQLAPRGAPSPLAVAQKVTYGLLTTLTGCGQFTRDLRQCEAVLEIGS
jgi:hypothetical protein